MGYGKRYQQYLKNTDWIRVRTNHLRTYPECRACGEVKDHMVVHHVRYRGPRGKSEVSGDLVTLCKEHHDELHQILGRTPAWGKQTIFLGTPV